MAETFLIASALLQAWAVAQAARLASRERRAGWVFLALAITLMLARRVVTILGAFSRQLPTDPVAEFLALMISLLMATGLTMLLHWPKPVAVDNATAEESQAGRIQLLKRQAVLLALLSLFGGAGLSYFTYTASRDAVTDRLVKGNLELAQTLRTAASSAPNRPAALGELNRLWPGAHGQYPDSYLRVVGADGKVLLDTRRQDMAGTPAETEAPGPVREFAAARRDWTGRHLDAKGEPQIAAYAYSTNLNALVGVLQPARGVDAGIRAAALPWGAGIALIFIAVLPLSFGLLYHVGSASEKAALQALRRQLESERRYSLLIDHVKDHAILLLDPEGRVTTWNPGAESLRGWPPEELQGRHFSGFYTAEDVARGQPGRDLQAAAEHGSMTTEGWRLLPGGARFFAGVAISCARDETGEPRGFVVVTRDISARKRAEAELERVDRALRMLGESNEAMIRIADEAMLLNEICRIAVGVGGYRMAWVGFAEQNDRRSVRPEARAGHEAGYLATAHITWLESESGCEPAGTAIRTGQPCVARNIANDPGLGPWRAAAIQHGYQSALALPLTSVGRVLGALGIYSAEANAFDTEELRILGKLAGDLAFGLTALRTRAERDRATEALKASEATYRSVVKAMAEGVVFQAASGEITAVNPAAERIEGRSAGQMLGRTPDDAGRDAIHEDGTPFPGDTHPAMVTLRTGQPQSDVIMGIQTPAGARKWISINSEPLMAGDRQKPSAVVTTFHDITERRQAEALLLKTYARLKIAMDLARLVHWEFEVQTSLFSFGDQFYKFYGTTAEREGGTQMSAEEYARRFIPPGETPVMTGALAQALATTDPNYFTQVEHRIIRGDGEERIVAVRLKVIQDGSGRTIRVYGANQDITERKNAEALVDGQKRVLELVAIGAPLPESLNALVRFVEAQAPGMLGSILLLDAEGVHLHHGAAPSLPPEYVAAIEGVAIGPQVGSCGTAAHFGEVVIVEDIATSPLWQNYKALALAHGLRACWSTPIFNSQQRVIGTLALYYRQPALPRPEDLRLIDLAAHTAAIAIGRQHAKTALQESTERLRLAVQASNVGLWDWNLRTNQVVFSREWKLQLGCEAHEIDSDYREWERRLHPDDVAPTLAALRDYLDGRQPEYAVEFRLRHKDGAYRWIYARGEVIRDTEGKPVRMLGCHVDVTSRKRAEAALRKSESDLQLALDGGRLGQWDWNIVTGETTWSARCLALYGLAPDTAMSYERFLAAMHSEDRARVDAALRRAVEERGTYEAEKRVPWPDGSIHWTASRGRVYCDAAGLAVRMTGVTFDITERKEAEGRIRQLNRTYAVLSDINQLIVREREPRAILDGACRIAVERGGFLLAWVGRLDGQSDRLELTAHAGATPGTREVLDGVLGGPLIPPALETGGHAVCNDIARDPRAAPWREAALRHGQRAMVSCTLTVDGQRFGTFNLHASEPGFFDDEELRLLDELAQDIGFALEVCQHEAEHRQAQEALRASDERLHELAETIEDVFWITDPAKNRMLYISPGYEKVWGRSCQSLYDEPRSWLESIHPVDRERVLRAATTRQVEGTYDEEYRIVRPDGQTRWVRDVAFPVRNAEGQVERVLGVARDITDRLQMAEQLRQSQKMEAIGQLAGGVAHDFNNIITAMLMQIDLAWTVENLPGEAREGLQQIRAAADRAANLTRQLLLFGRKQVMQPCDLDLNEVVTNLARMLQRIIGEDVSLQLHLHSAPLMTRADAGMLDQVLMNLAVNARDAMPAGGRLLIETAEKVLDESLARLHPDAAPGRYVQLSMSDTGSGIPPEVLPRIFEPFFTTKEPGKGTGLGLATVFGIVKQHRGWLQVESEPGRGTSLQVFLRAAEVSADAQARATAHPKPRGGAETILLVEDEAVVRLPTRALLERNGYRVLEAANGAEALKVWAEHGQSAALLLTDLVMPGGMTGHQLARRLQQDSPRLKVLFTSGYSGEMAGRDIGLRSGENFMQKPFSPDQLLETVRRCLDG